MGIQINGSTDRITAIDGTIDFVSNIGNIGLITASRYELQDSITIGAGSTIIKTVNGDLGIGSAIPSAKLDVAGIIKATDFKAPDGNGNGLYAGNSDDLHLFHNGADSHVENDTGNLNFTNKNNNNIIFKTTSSETERLRITSDGKVGINEDVPQATLHVASTSSYVDIGLSNSTSGHTGSDGANIFYNSNLELALWNRESASIRFATAGTERARIDGSGHATFKRSFNLDSSSDNAHIREGRSWTWTSNGVSSGTVRAYLYGDSSGSLRLGSGGWNERLRINSDGRVWIGSHPNTGSSATELLRISNYTNASDDSRMSLISGGAAQAVLLFGDDQSFDQGQIVYSNVDHSMRFHANAGGERLRIDSSGHTLFSGVTSNVDTRNVAGITVKSPGGISLKSFGANGSRNWRIRPDDLNGWADLDFSCAPTDGSTDIPDNATDAVLSLQGDTKDVVVSNGNLKIGVAGKGIDFSATGGGSGTSNESEILTDYEHGEWTPVLQHYISGGFSAPSYSAAGTVVGRYTKIGNIVHISASFLGFNISNAHGSSFARITGLPFTSMNHPNHRDIMATCSDAFNSGGVVFSTYWNQTNLNSMRHGNGVFDWGVLQGGAADSLVVSGHYTAA